MEWSYLLLLLFVVPCLLMVWMMSRQHKGAAPTSHPGQGEDKPPTVEGTERSGPTSRE